MFKHSFGLPVAALLIVPFAGCATFSPDGGFRSVATDTKARLDADVVWARDPVAQAALASRRSALLAQPLSLQNAVQLALYGNHGLQADFAALQVSEADLVQAGRLPNPRFDFLRAARAGQVDIEEGITFNVLALLTQPWVHKLEAQRFAAAQQSAIEAVQRLALDTRAAYVDALAADAALQQARNLHEAADLAATLAARMQRAGNWSRIDEAHEQQFLFEATRTLREAETTQVAARQRLLGMLGLDDSEAGTLRLAAHLPDLPAALEAQSDLEQVILENRIDLKRQRLELDALARQLKLTRVTRFVNVLDVGATRIKQGGDQAPYEPGVRVSLEIPLFDSGAPRVRRAEGVYARAAGRYAQAALDARAQVRRADAAYRAAYALARQEQDQALPLRQAVTAENLKRYNAGQLSVFDLLTDARDTSGAVLSSIEAQRRFWHARARLDAALLGADATEVTS